MYHHLSLAAECRTRGFAQPFPRGKEAAGAPSLSFLVASGQLGKVLPALLASSSGRCGPCAEASLMGIFLYIFINY